MCAPRCECACDIKGKACSDILERPACLHLSLLASVTTAGHLPHMAGSIVRAALVCLDFIRVDGQRTGNSLFNSGGEMPPKTPDNKEKLNPSSRRIILL